jgi:ATP-dependent Lon protease
MTGEITLRGKVLPVGGIKEKILAAARFGLKTVILPKHNEADLDDVPQTVREQMQFVLVDTVDEVLAAALDEPVSNPDDTAAIRPNGLGVATAETIIKH